MTNVGNDTRLAKLISDAKEHHGRWRYWDGDDHVFTSIPERLLAALEKARVGSKPSTYQTTDECQPAASLGDPVGIQTATPHATPDRSAEPIAPDPGLKKQVRDPKEALSAFKVLRDHCYPASTTSGNHPVGVAFETFWQEWIDTSGSLDKYTAEAAWKAALASRPTQSMVSVTDEMVERALDAWFTDPKWREVYADGPDVRAYIRAALNAALGHTAALLK